MGKREPLILLFDLDDTLVPSSKAYDFGMESVEVAPDDATFLKARDEIKKLCPLGYPAARSRRLYFKRYLELRERFSPGAHLRMVRNYERAVCSFLENAWVRLDRPTLFESLREAADVIGIITNESSTFQSAKLELLDPEWKFFDFVVTSEDLGHEKPHPALIKRALQLAEGKAAPEAMSPCIVIGDHFEHDILPALKLGIRAIQTREFTTPENVHDSVISKLDELCEII